MGRLSDVSLTEACELCADARHPCLQRQVVAVTALKLTPLLFVRPGELRAAERREFDLDAAAWRIPAAKMKMKTEHMAPLATQAAALLFPSLRSE